MARPSEQPSAWPSASVAYSFHHFPRHLPFQLQPSTRCTDARIKHALSPRSSYGSVHHPMPSPPCHHPCQHHAPTTTTRYTDATINMLSPITSIAGGVIPAASAVVGYATTIEVTTNEPDSHEGMDWQSYYVHLEVRHAPPLPTPHPGLTHTSRVLKAAFCVFT